MNKFIQQHKERARNKQITSSNMIAHCVFKAVTAKSDNTHEIYKHFAKKAFTKKKNVGNYCEGHWYAYRVAVNRFLRANAQPRIRGLWKRSSDPVTTFEGIPYEEVFTETELLRYIDLIDNVKELSLDD